MTSSELPRIDEAREWIAKRCADLLRDGSFQIRLRIVAPNGEPTGALLYRRDANHWVRKAPTVDDASLAIAVRSVMQMLASHPPTDVWRAHHHFASDFEDIDLQFHRDAVGAHADDNLQSRVSGVLLKDAHASRQDRRTAPQRIGTNDASRRR